MSTKQFWLSAISPKERKQIEKKKKEHGFPNAEKVQEDFKERL